MWKVVAPGTLDLELKRWTSGETSPEEERFGRIHNLVRYRDTKSGATTPATWCGLFMARGKGVLASRPDRSRLDLSAMTHDLGCLGMAIDEDTPPWDCDQSIFLVESQALIDNFGWLPRDWCGVVLYYAGDLPGLLIAWLAWIRFASIELFADFAGIGLPNFQTLTAGVPSASWY
ncbi:MAG: hypothetical protein H6686_06570 [Fibrobacteria bacterium]|nr:hypothetical protein [Fibrobacteria bacterium]